MRQIKLFIAASLFASLTIACSSDDSDPVAVNDTYIDTNPDFKAVFLSSQCNASFNAIYCVTSTVRNEISDFLMSELANGNECPLVTFNDVDGVERQGYVTGTGTNSGCTRQTNP